MAFGALKGVLTGAAGSITNPFNATGSVSVAVGDLIFVCVAERNTMTATGVTDNLGHTYNALDADDAGNATAATFWVVATSAGTLTQVSAAVTASGADVAMFAAVYEGVFAASPLDVNPTTVLNDIATPFVGPASGTLAQADELVLAWFALTNGSTTIGVGSPFTLDSNPASGTATNTIGVGLASDLVASTASVQPSWTTSTGGASTVLGLASFKKDTGGGPPSATHRMFAVF